MIFLPILIFPFSAQLFKLRRCNLIFRTMSIETFENADDYYFYYYVEFKQAIDL